MRKLVLPGAVLAALLVTAGNAGAQTSTGQITGTVKDSSGAVVPSATVTVTNELTGAKRETTTGVEGDYTIPLLQVGTYSVTAELQGFRAARITGIRLNVAQVLRVDLELKAGVVTEVIEITARTTAIDTETAGIAHLVTEKQITDLPLNNRSFLSLLFLGAGAVETTGEQGSMRQGMGNAISLMGSRPTSNNYMLDGTANVDTALGTPAVVLSVDAIEEFKEQTKTYSAEYGFSANQVNIVTKSGTNKFHGSLFAFLRDEALDAKSFFDAPDQEKPPLDQKQFGGTISGPLIKNKTLFMVNYEGTRLENGISSFATVPTPDELAGRFSETIIDPLTGQPFPNNTIPPERFSRLAQLVLRNDWYPTPNYTGPQGNYQAVRTLPTNQDQFTARIDQDLGKLGRAFARFTKTSYSRTTGGILTPDIGDSIFEQETTHWQVSHTWPIRADLVNVLRVGRLAARADQVGVACPQEDVEFLGLTGRFTGLSEGQRGCPGVTIDGYAGVGGPVNDYTTSNQPMWDVSNTLTWVKGSHTVKVGVNFRRWWLQRDLANDFLGNWGFNTDIVTGNALADFLLGYYGSVSVFQPGPGALEGKVGNPREYNLLYFAPYIQDDWRVSSNLTLNLGLRWDYRNVPYETNDRMGWRNPDYAPGGLLMADQSLVADGIADGGYYQYAGRRSPENPDRFKVFAPRLGFAWRPFGNDKTVIRGGYGIFYDQAEGRELDGSTDLYPYLSRSEYRQTALQAEPYRTTDQMFPVISPGVATPDKNTFIAVMMSPFPKNPYVQQWSFGVQRQLAGSTTLELNYVGSHGSNLLMRRNIAQAYPYDPDNPTSVAERKPYPNFAVYIDSDWSGYADYHGLNTVLTHRSRGLVASVAYTWAKSTDSKSAAAGIGSSGFSGWQGFLNNHDPERDHGLSDFDVDHRIAASFVWNLPFGKGERFGGDATGVVQALIGGWQLNGIYTWQRGFPITITAFDLGGLCDVFFFANRADVVSGADIHAGGGTLEQWFNTDAFAQPTPGHLGNSGRNILRGPGRNNLDLSLFKNFNLPADATLQLRLEAFNALNHPQFTTVGTNVSVPTFGVVTGARAGRIVQLGVKLLW